METTDIYIIMKDDQIEFHEIGESRKAEHAFHSDGYKIKGMKYSWKSQILLIRPNILKSWPWITYVSLMSTVVKNISGIRISRVGSVKYTREASDYILIKFCIPFVVIKFIRRVSPCTRSKLICFCHKGGFINAMQLLCIQGLDS